MITPLRRRHRWLAPGSFVCALAGLAVALAARPTEFIERARHGHLVRGVLPEHASILAERPHFTLASTAAPEPRLWLVPRTALDAPDLLVYRVDALDAADGDALQLPPDAQLLGPASPTAATSFPWTPGPIAVVLYSLGHRRRFDTVDLSDVRSAGPSTREAR